MSTLPTSSNQPVAVAVGGGGSATVNQVATCIQCGYALQGLPTAGKCPECGTAVADSLRGFLLQFAGRQYLETITKGLSFVLNGILAMVILMIVGFVMAFGLVTAGGGLTAFSVLLTGASTVISLAILWGYWQFTELDPGSAALDTERSSRKVVRVAVVVSAVVAVLSLLIELSGVAGSARGTGAGAAVDTTAAVINGGLRLASAAAWIAQFFAVMRYTRLLGQRMPDAFIVKRCSMYMWLLPVLQTVGILLVGLGPLIALVMYWNLLDRLRKHLKSILATGAPAQLPKMAG